MSKNTREDDFIFNRTQEEFFMLNQGQKITKISIEEDGRQKVDIGFDYSYPMDHRDGLYIVSIQAKIPPIKVMLSNPKDTQEYNQQKQGQLRAELILCQRQQTRQGILIYHRLNHGLNGFTVLPFNSALIKFRNIGFQRFTKKQTTFYLFIMVYRLKDQVKIYKDLYISKPLFIAYYNRIIFIDDKSSLMQYFALFRIEFLTYARRTKPFANLKDQIRKFQIHLTKKVTQKIMNLLNLAFMYPRACELYFYTTTKHTFSLPQPPQDQSQKQYSCLYFQDIANILIETKSSIQKMQQISPQSRLQCNVLNKDCKVVFKINSSFRTKVVLAQQFTKYLSIVNDDNVDLSSYQKLEGVHIKEFYRYYLAKVNKGKNKRSIFEKPFYYEQTRKPRQEDRSSHIYNSSSQDEGQSESLPQKSEYDEDKDVCENIKKMASFKRQRNYLQSKQSSNPEFRVMRSKRKFLHETLPKKQQLNRKAQEKRKFQPVNNKILNQASKVKLQTVQIFDKPSQQNEEPNLTLSRQYSYRSTVSKNNQRYQKAEKQAFRPIKNLAFTVPKQQQGRYARSNNYLEQKYSPFCQDCERNFYHWLRNKYQADSYLDKPLNLYPTFDERYMTNREPDRFTNNYSRHPYSSHAYMKTYNNQRDDQLESSFFNNSYRQGRPSRAIRQNRQEDVPQQFSRDYQQNGHMRHYKNEHFYDSKRRH